MILTTAPNLISILFESSGRNGIDSNVSIFIFKISCMLYEGLWAAKALEGDAKVSVDVKDITIQRRASCYKDSVCRARCHGCAIKQCIFQQLMCLQSM